jgi:hypothetical protein
MYGKPIDNVPTLWYNEGKIEHRDTEGETEMDTKRTSQEIQTQLNTVHAERWNAVHQLTAIEDAAEGFSYRDDPQYRALAQKCRGLDAQIDKLDYEWLEAKRAEIAELAKDPNWQRAQS